MRQVVPPNPDAPSCLPVLKIQISKYDEQSLKQSLRQRWKWTTSEKADLQGTLLQGTLLQGTLLPRGERFHRFDAVWWLRSNEGESGLSVLQPAGTTRRGRRLLLHQMDTLGWSWIHMRMVLFLACIAGLLMTQELEFLLMASTPCTCKSTASQLSQWLWLMIVQQQVAHSFCSFINHFMSQQ